MARANRIQFNVRSAFARTRAHELATLTGMTVTQVVEDALRAYVPPGAKTTVGRLVPHGRILVLPSTGPTISLADADEALDAVRERDLGD